MRKSALLVLVFIMALSAFSFGAFVPEGEGEEEEEKESVDHFSVDNVKYHVTEDGVVEIEGIEDGATSIAIPKEVKYEEETYKVTAIAESAFSQNKNLVSVTIPGSVKEIPDQTFMGCTSLTTIKLDDGVEIIGNSAFEGCSNLNELTTPKSVKEMGKSLFKDCSSLKKIVIEGDLKKIDENLFKNCDKLESIEVKGDVELIDDKTFEGHKALKSVKFGGNVNEIGKESFKGCEKLETFDLKVKKIDDSAFEGCSKLEDVTIPESLEEMGKSVFKDCESLKTVVFEGVFKEIEETLFMNCENLTTLEIKGDLELIDESAFEGHKNLNTVKFGGNVDEIGKNAFKDCVSLETIEFSENKEVNIIGESAFEGCISLKEIFIPGSLELIEKATFKGCETLDKIEIETGVKEIGESAFEGCSSLEEVTIPSTVKKVGEMAFKDCTKLTTVKLEEGVEEIGNSAFTGCDELKMVTIPASVKEIGESVFEGSSLEELVIPASMKVIQVSAFKNSVKLKKVTIEDGVEEIGDSAFVGCIALEELTLSKTLKKIGVASFGGCESLTELIIPDEVEEIGQAAFKDCEKIDSLLLGEGLKELGDSAFMGCSSLPYVVIPNSTTSIAKATFKECEKLDYVQMAEGLMEIKESAFEGCISLDSLRLPATATIIEEAAFRNCDSLVWVKVEYMEPIDIEESVFEGIDSMAVLQVPKGTKAIYEANVGWSANFAKIIGGTYRITFVSKGGGEAICKLDSLLKESLKSDSIMSDSTIYNSIMKDSIMNDTLSIRNDSLTVTFMEGDSILVAFESDEGFQIKDVMVNDNVITDSLFADIYKADTLSTEKPRFGQYIISYLDDDYTVAVEFERIRYNLTLVSVGEGVISFENEEVFDTTKVFKLVEGSNATVSFNPNTGWRIKAVDVDSIDITSEIPIYQYTIKNIRKHTKLTAQFEEIPITQYILTVYASGAGEVTVGKRTIRDNSYVTYINENTNAVLTINPDEGHVTSSLKVNGKDVTSAIVDNQYTIIGIRADMIVNVLFDNVEMTFAKDGVHYQVSSIADHKVTVTLGDNMQVLEVPSTVTYSNTVWEVADIKEDALSNCPDLTAVIWNPSAMFKAKVSNPNFLLYVNQAKFVAWAEQNAVVDGRSKSIVLSDAKNGNDFYCPRSFTAEKISYTHNYSMETGITESKGWETIALPFDVQIISHATAGTILPFKVWTSESEAKPFWLYELTSDGYQEAEGIKAYTPYLISMPNNSLYMKDYRIVGKVTFEAKDVEVKATKDLNSTRYSDRTFVPNFTNKEDESILALNVNNSLVNYTESDMGGRFVKGLRAVHPFEAYMTTTSNTRSVSVLDDMTTAIKEIRNLTDEKAQGYKVYDLRGVLVKSGASMEEIKSGLKAGVYMVQGKKMIIK